MHKNSKKGQKTPKKGSKKGSKKQEILVKSIQNARKRVQKHHLGGVGVKHEVQKHEKTPKIDKNRDPKKTVLKGWFGGDLF